MLPQGRAWRRFFSGQKLFCFVHINLLNEGFYGSPEKTLASNVQFELMGESCFITEIKLESTIIIRFAVDIPSDCQRWVFMLISDMNRKPLIGWIWHSSPLIGHSESSQFSVTTRNVWILRSEEKLCTVYSGGAQTIEHGSPDTDRFPGYICPANICIVRLF